VVGSTPGNEVAVTAQFYLSVLNFSQLSVSSLLKIVCLIVAKEMNGIITHFNIYMENCTLFPTLYYVPAL
jgi:hypothetical protein